MKTKPAKQHQAKVLPQPLRELKPSELRQVAGGAFPFIQNAAVKPENSALAFPFIQT